MAKSKKSKAAILDDAPAENTVKIESAKNLKSTTNTDAFPKKKSKRAVKKEIKAVIDDIDNVNSSFEEIADLDMNGEEDFVVTGGDGETTVEGLEEAPMIGQCFKIFILNNFFRCSATGNRCYESRRVRR